MRKQAETLFVACQLLAAALYLFISIIILEAIYWLMKGVHKFRDSV